MYLTQTKGDGIEETGETRERLVKRGLSNFELTTTIKHKGVLHLTLDHTAHGKPFGGVYFGTPDQMSSVSDLTSEAGSYTSHGNWFALTTRRLTGVSFDGPFDVSAHLVTDCKFGDNAKGCAKHELSIATIFHSGVPTATFEFEGSMKRSFS